MKKQKKYTWGDIHALTIRVANIIKKYDIDSVVGISRGGLIPAAIISNWIDKELFCVGVKSYDHTMAQLEIVMTQTLDSKYIQDKKILIVDDICDTGVTLSYLDDLFKTNGARAVRTCAILKRSQSSYDPTFVAEIIEDDSWIIFPWES